MPFAYKVIVLATPFKPTFLLSQALANMLIDAKDVDRCKFGRQIFLLITTYVKSTPLNFHVKWTKNA